MNISHSSILTLSQEYAMFFQKHYRKTVAMSDRLEFVNGWYILIIISDALTITGSVMKMCIQTKVSLTATLRYK